jgi:glucose-1-phosphate adenylyltransferase
MDQVASVILAGGEGTRLFPLTRCRCKPDVRFAGRYRLIDVPISNSINSKLQNIFVISQHFATSLHQHILSTYPASHFQNHKITILTPKDGPGKKNLFRGTADAVRQNLGSILPTAGEYVLILAGDQLYHMDYHEMLEFAKNVNADLIIAAIRVEEPEAKRMGLLKIDDQSHVLDFFEKPTDRMTLESFALEKKPDHPQQYLGSMGIYVFKKSALINLLKLEGDDFSKHIIPHQVQQGKTFAFIFNGYWEDIGTIAAYYHANLALTNDQNWMQAFTGTHQLYTPHHNFSTPLIKQTTIAHSLINQGALIEAKEVTHSIIGINTWIKENTIIRDSIITGENGEKHSVMIGKNCFIQKAIIDSDVIIGDNVRLANVNQLQKVDSGNVFIRDGIIIVTAGARLPDGYIL